MALRDHCASPLWGAHAGQVRNPLETRAAAPDCGVHADIMGHARESRSQVRDSYSSLAPPAEVHCARSPQALWRGVQDDATTTGFRVELHADGRAQAVNEPLGPGAVHPAGQFAMILSKVVVRTVAEFERPG